MNQSSAPGAQQVLRRGNSTGCLINGHRGHPIDPALTGHKNPGSARRLGPELIQGRNAPRQDNGDLHPISGELVESHGDRDRGVVPGRDHDELIALLPSGVRNRRENGRRAMTELRGEQHAHCATATGRQRPRRKIGTVAETLDGGVDTGTGLGAHRGMIVQDARDRLLGHARLTGDITHHHRAHAHLTFLATPHSLIPAP